jgi:hypothetical protein
MDIVVSHLTRMQAGYICVAGYQPRSLQHIRPVLLNRRLPRSLYQAEGGPFGLGFLVELGPVRDVGAPPELEDREFSEERAAALHQLPPEQFWGKLESMVSPDLAAGFGTALERQDSGFAVPLGQGAASLACLVPDGDVALKVNDYGKIRCNFDVKDGPADLSVTDIRLCESDHKTIRRSLVRRLDRRMADGTRTILALGLARPFQASGDTEQRHWLQVNNIFLADDPYIE